jgi:hypothetical protein
MARALLVPCPELPMVWALLFALTSSAEAYTLCLGPEVVATVPPVNAVDVPRDVRISLQYGNACSDSWEEKSATLWTRGGADEEQLVGSGIVTNGRHDLGSFHADAELDARADYQVSGAWDFAVRTGEHLAPELTGEISGEVIEASFDRGEDLLRFQARIVPVPDPSGLSVIELVDPSDPDVVLGGAIVGEAEEVRAIALWELDRRPDTVCVDALHRDAAGRQVGEPLRLCEDRIDTSGGCSTAGASPAWLALLTLLFVRRAR